MRKLGGILGVIIGAVLLLGACEKPTPAMTFLRLDPNFGGLHIFEDSLFIGNDVSETSAASGVQVPQPTNHSSWTLEG